MWKEWTIGNLAVEPGGPPPGNLTGATWTTAIWGEPVAGDEISVTLDQRFRAMGAARVLPRLDDAGEIAGINVVQSGVSPDLDGAQKILDCGISLVLHFVIRMECGDMPWNIRRDAGDEVGKLAELIFRVVEAGDQQSDNLEPQPHRVDAANAVENGANASTEFVVMTVIETLEVDLVQI